MTAILITKLAELVGMYYGSETGERCCTCAGQTLRLHPPDGSTFLREMT